MDYRQSGVNIDAGNEAVRRIKTLARATFTPDVLSEIGSFGGLFRLPLSGYSEPVLVSAPDGVGTKLKLAFMSGRHDTVGQDLVNHCVNDILVQGATPLFFLDYLATGRLVARDRGRQVVSGMARRAGKTGARCSAARLRKCPASTPTANTISPASSSASSIVPASSTAGHRPGDVLIGVPSTGLHTNGYSLARRIAFEQADLSFDDLVPELGTTIGEALLAIHRSYLPVLLPLLGRRLVKGMAHITGGGITDNLPRILPEGRLAIIERRAWDTPPLFQFLAQAGEVPTTRCSARSTWGSG